MTRVSQHTGPHREYDGANDWCSLLPLLRRAFEKDPQWLSLVHQGSDKTRCQYCLDSNGDLIYFRAIQGQQEPWLIPRCWTMLKFHLERIFVRRRFVDDTLHASRIHRWTGHHRRQTVFTSHLDHPTRSIKIKRKPRKVRYKSWWKNNPGRNLLDQFEKKRQRITILADPI